MYILKKIKLSRSNKLLRFLWFLVYISLFRYTPVFCHAWRCGILRMFGAKIGVGVHPYPSAKIWAPWNLEMGDFSCLSHNVDCYNVAKVVLGKNVTISQYCFLCTATHDYTNRDFSLMVSPIVIGSYVWITADVFIAPGVIIGEGSVVNARSSVFSDIAPWVIAKGNPAKAYKKRILDEHI